MRFPSSSLLVSSLLLILFAAGCGKQPSVAVHGAIVSPETLDTSSTSLESISDAEQEAELHRLAALGATTAALPPASAPVSAEASGGSLSLAGKQSATSVKIQRNRYGVTTATATVTFSVSATYTENGLATAISPSALRLSAPKLSLPGASCAVSGASVNCVFGKTGAHQITVPVAAAGATAPMNLPFSVSVGADDPPCGLLTRPNTLRATQVLPDCNDHFQLIMQTDGNLVLYEGYYKNPRWSSGTYGHAGAYTVMQTDGNLVVYSAAGAALWSSGTFNHPASRAAVQKDGNFVIYDAQSRPRWDSETARTHGSQTSLIFDFRYLFP